jgi:predicted enzyme related to lactoylglutathione lyase
MAKLPNTFAHTQLNTDDPAQARRFYRSLFAWKLKDLKMGPGMTYTMIDTQPGDGGEGGIQQQAMPGAPPAWMTYVQVADVKKVMAKAERLGAKVQVAYQPIPGMGAFGVFTDPTGAVLGVWEPPRQPARKPAGKKRR